MVACLFILVATTFFFQTTRFPKSNILRVGYLEQSSAGFLSYVFSSVFREKKKKRDVRAKFAVVLHCDFCILFSLRRGHWRRNTHWSDSPRYDCARSYCNNH